MALLYPLGLSTTALVVVGLCTLNPRNLPDLDELTARDG
jgi:hypothetical protein